MTIEICTYCHFGSNKTTCQELKAIPYALSSTLLTLASHQYNTHRYPLFTSHFITHNAGKGDKSAFHIS